MKRETNKKIFFIPGLAEKPKDYKSLAKFLNIIDVDWNSCKIKLSGNIDTLIGFSLGAILACEYALKHKVKHLILCSMTPGAETLKKIKANKVDFLVGQKEKWILQDIKRIAKTLKSSWKIAIIPKADHKIDKKYQKTLLNLTS